jgi:enoyl-CoA hydratase
MPKKKQGLPLYRYEERITTDDFEEIIYEKDGPIGRLILNSPEKRNPLSYRRIVELSMGLQAMEMDDDIRVIIIKGAGPAFCSGYDLTPGKAQDNNPNPNDPRARIGYADVGDPPGGVFINEDKDGPSFYKYTFFSRELYFRIFDLQKPVIAQIHGYCLAGATHLAGFSDMRIVSEDAQIGFPVAKNLTIEGFQYEIWLMGATRAKYYLMTGDPMDGKQAYDWGWASAVFPADKLEEETEKLARRIALTDPVLLMMQKRTINRQMELMGFKTGMAWSQDVHMAGAGARRGGTEEAKEFWRISQESGLRAAVDWRDSHFGIAYPAKSTT